MRHLLPLLLLVFGSALGQTLPDSLAVHREAIQEFDSLKGAWLTVPDTLKPVFAKADSVRAEFRLAADTLQSRYARAIAAIEAQEQRLAHTVDSLRQLRLPTEKYAEPIERLQRRRREIVLRYGEQLDALKTKTTARLASLDLPPAYQQPIRELADKINGAGLRTAGIDLPKLGLPGLDLPDIDVAGLQVRGLNVPGPDNLDIPGVDLPAGDIPTDLGQLPDTNLPMDDLKEITGKVDAYQDEIGDIAGKAKDVNSIPEAIENQASRVESLGEVQKQSAAVEQYKTQLAEAQDPEKAKARAVELGRKAAVDHFAGKEEQLKTAMDKLARYKKKYTSVSSIRDLPKRPPNPMKGKPFIERLVPGMDFQHQRKNAYLLDVNPHVGYRISDRFTAGLGWNHRYAYIDRHRGFDPRSRIFGPRAYVDFKLGKGFIAHLEGETMNTVVPSTLRGNPDAGVREWVWGCVTGIRKEYRIYKQLKGTALIQYNIFHPAHKSPYVDRVNSRIGFAYTIRKSGK